jgi:hypothetical protein
VVGENLDVPDGFVDRLRTMRPCLPEDPTAAQLEAWIELGDLVQDEEFRGAVRSYLQETYGTFPGRSIASAPMQTFIYETGAGIMEEILEAYRSGLAADSPRARELVVGVADASYEVVGGQSTPESRERLASAYLMLPELEREESPREDRYDATHGRYLSLVNAINGTPPDEIADENALYAWIAAALQASV